MDHYNTINTAGDWINTIGDSATTNYPYGDYWQPFEGTAQPYHIPVVPWPEEDEKERISRELRELIEKYTNKKECPMKTLFNVIVVDLDGKILLDEKTVAEDSDEAKFNVDVSSVIKEAKLKPKEVTVITEEVGDVKARKEIETVKVIKEKE